MVNLTQHGTFKDFTVHLSGVEGVSFLQTADEGAALTERHLKTKPPAQKSLASHINADLEVCGGKPEPVLLPS